MELYECNVWCSFQWHLGFFTEDYTPNRRGFDSFYGYYSGMEDYFDHTYAAGWPDRVSMLSSCITALCCALLSPNCWMSSEELWSCLVNVVPRLKNSLHRSLLLHETSTVYILFSCSRIIVYCVGDVIHSHVYQSEIKLQKDIGDGYFKPDDNLFIDEWGFGKMMQSSAAAQVPCDVVCHFKSVQKNLIRNDLQ